MIGRLHGILLEKCPPSLLIDVHGVGYEVDVPMSTFYGLPATGQPVTLVTHMAVRDDGHFLYGFATADERRAFRQLLKVSGIGARTALSVLSGLSVDELARAVTLDEASRLTKIPGIGKKTAERLVLELRDKLVPALTPPGTPVPPTGLAAPADARSDILNALLALGYNDREARAAMKPLPDDVQVAEGIRAALKSLAKP